MACTNDDKRKALSVDEGSTADRPLKKSLSKQDLLISNPAPPRNSIPSSFLGRLRARKPRWSIPAGLLVMFVGLWLSNFRFVSKSAPGRLVSDLSDFSYTLGRFTVEWKRETSQLLVIHTKRWCMWNCQAVVWDTLPGSSFLTVADGSVHFRETMAGHYHVSRKQALQTTVQTLDQVHYSPKTRSLTLSGILLKEHAFARIAWLQLSNLKATWTELQMLLHEYKADLLLRTPYNFTFTEQLSHTGGRLAFTARWDPAISNGPQSQSHQLHHGPSLQGLLNRSLVEADPRTETEVLEEHACAAPRVAPSAEGAEATSDEEEETDASPDEYVAAVPRRGSQRQYDLVQLTYRAEAGERFYGLGAQFSSTDHRGKRVPILSQEQGIGRGLQPMTWALNRIFRGAGGQWHNTYTAIPHYISSSCRSIFAEGYDYMEFDFTTPETITIEAIAPTGIFSGQIVAGRTPLEVVEAYTEFSGRMKPLPDWSQEGAIIGMTGGAARVKEVVRDLQGAGVPVVGVWMQDWTGIRNTTLVERIWWNWVLDDSHYPDWPRFLQDLDASGIKILTYVNPFLMKASGPKGALYREAASKGFLVKNKRGAPYRMVQEIAFGLLDLSNPACVKWIEGIIRDNMLLAGADDNGRPRVAGWMADFGEYLPFDAPLASGELPSAVHNRYPEEWAAINHRVLKELKMEKEGFFFSRSATIRSPTYTPLLWMGDQLVSWDSHDGIKSAVHGMLSAGLSGFSLCHSDIGGYTATPTRARSQQLLMRWMELSALSDAIFRTHQGSRPFHNHQVWTSTEAKRHFAYTAGMFRALAVYRKKLMREAQDQGAPLNRALFLHYPQDDVASTVAHEFLVGRDLLAAPVLDRNMTRVHVYLPPGDTWSDAWTNQPVPFQPTKDDGVWITVDAPMGFPGLFLRGGACKEASAAAANLRALAAAHGGLPEDRRVLLMDPVEKLVLGYFNE